MIGAVGGSLMNLVYPYFLDAKGWRGPQYRRVQLYDFIARRSSRCWCSTSRSGCSAPSCCIRTGRSSTSRICPNLLSNVLGESGRILFYAGIFAAVYTSIIGHAAGLGSTGHPRLAALDAPEPVPIAADFRHHPCYRWIAISCLVPPLIWTLPGMPGFVALTLAANSAQVILLPLLAGGLWWITASERLIGREYRNRWWENAVMGPLRAGRVTSPFRRSGIWWADLPPKGGSYRIDQSPKRFLW